MFEFLIDTLEGEPLLADLENVGACYPDDDVIYMFGIPCRLSSARPVAAEHHAHADGACPHANTINPLGRVFCPDCCNLIPAPQVA